MVLELEYNELKTEATGSLSELYQSFVKRLDNISEKSEEAWTPIWKEYRSMGGNLGAILPMLPEWVQRNFQHFANLQRFSAEIQRAFVHYEKEIDEAYRLGLKRGREQREPNNQQWRGYRNNFDRMRQFDSIPHTQRLCYTKELLRQRTVETARHIWNDHY